MKQDNLLDFSFTHYLHKVGIGTTHDSIFQIFIRISPENIKFIKIKFQ